MPKNFYKRGVAPLIPLIVSALVLVSAMAASLIYQNQPQETRSRAATCAGINACQTVHTPCCQSGTTPLFNADCGTFPRCVVPTKTPTPFAAAYCENGTVRSGTCCRAGGMCVNVGGLGVCNLNRTDCPVATRTPTSVPRCTTLGSCCPNNRTCIRVGTTDLRCSGTLCTVIPTRSLTPTSVPRCTTLGSCCPNNRTCIRVGTTDLRCSGTSCTALATRTPTQSSLPTRTPTRGTTCANACSTWRDAGCEAGNCGPSQMYQTRTCTISGCTLSRCISSSCIITNPTRTPTRSTAATRTPTGVTNPTRTPTSVTNPTRTPTSGGATPTRTPTSSACGVSVSLTAIPSTSTTNSLSNVDLRATVTAGSGTITYRFYCLASQSTYSRQVSTTANPYTAVDLCDYSGGGQKTAKVIITSATCNATAQTTISLSGLATPTRTRTPTTGTTNPTRTPTTVTTNPTRTSTPGGPTRTRTPTPGGATRTRTPTPFGNPTNTPVPPPTDGPTPTSSQDAAGLTFAISLPDVTADTVQASDVQVMLRSDAAVVNTANVELVRNGDYFQTSNPVFFNSAQNQSYTVFIKTKISVGREFNGVTLIPAQTQECINGSGVDCGDLVDNRDLKILESGDSDGFNTSSGSYNKIDSADLQVIAVQFNSSPPSSGSSGDYNLDGNVDISDLEIIGKNYGIQGD